MGIEMGTPYFKLKGMAGLLFRSSNYELYGDMSARIASVLGTYTPDVEPYSIDEAFLHFTGESQATRAGGWEELGKAIRARVLRWTGIPCGVGFAKTRTLAKIANHIGKKLPGGVYAMPDDATPVLERLPVEEVWGVGRRLSDWLKRWRVRTAFLCLGGWTCGNRRDEWDGGDGGGGAGSEGFFEGVEVGGEALLGVEAGGLGVAGPDVEGEAGAARGAGEVLDGGEETGGVAAAAEGFVETEVVEVEVAAGHEVAAGGRLLDAAEGVAHDPVVGVGTDEDGRLVVGEEAFEFGGGVFGAAGDEDVGAALGVDVVDLVEEFQQARNVGGCGPADGGGMG